VLVANQKWQAKGRGVLDAKLRQAAGVPFYNISQYTFEKLKAIRAISPPIWLITSTGFQIVDGTSFFKKMRKSLGNKRHEICDEQKDEITQLYGDMREGRYVRIFDNEDFGYRRITVERPLKLNFAVNEVRISRLQGSSAFQKLATSKKRKDTEAAQVEIEKGLELQRWILSALDTLTAKDIIKNRHEFSGLVKEIFKEAGLRIPTALFQAILTSLSECDETADVVTDAKGNPEPDKELRDYENVPLKEDIDKYMEGEVLPHMPDAWVDESKTKVGYEINFNRYFYEYQPPRPFEEIEGDLQQIEREIVAILEE